jgi:hypothetical protein
MSIEQRPSCVLAQVTGSSGALVQATPGIVSCTRSGTGVYSLVTTGTALNKQSIQCQVLGGAGNANIQVSTADGITFAITTFVGAVATDENFIFFAEPTAT